MKGREHMYWALMAFSIYIFAFSVQQGYYEPGNFTWFALIVTIIASMTFNEIANTMASRKKKEDEEKKKSGNVDDSKSGSNLPETITRVITYVTLVLVMIVCTYVGMKGADHVYFVLVAYLVTAFGGTFPDFIDSTIPGDMRFHRDPWSHSAVFASAFAAGCLLSVEYDYVSLNLFAIAFLLGNTVHLMCDNIESGSTLAAALSDMKKLRECPGDIRKIREDRERTWLNTQSIMAFLLIAFISFRYGMTDANNGFMAGIVIYDTMTSTFTFSTISITMILIIVSCYAVTLISFIAWKDKKGKTKKKKSSKPSSLKLSKST